MAAALVAAALSAPVQAGAAPQDSGTGLEMPDSVWTPPQQVNRKPVGGPPPERPRRGGAIGVATLPCGQYDYGIKQDHPLERFPVSDRSEMLVNTHDGNLVITARDLSMRGTGQHLSVSHVFNSRERFGPFAIDGKWKLNTGADVYLEGDPGSHTTVRGPSGYCATFDERADGSFASAPGLRADLQRLDDGSYALTWHDNKERWTFSPQGWLLAQTDRNGNANSMRYYGDGTLASITDSQGRVTTFDYTGDNRVSEIIDPTGTPAATFSYANGRLSSYTDRAGGRTTLEYDAQSGQLSALTDPSNRRYEMTFDADGSLLTLTTPTADGPATTRFDYTSRDTSSADKTVLTDANNHDTVYDYDQQGRQTKATDALGHTRSQTWTAHSDVAVSTDGLNNSTTRGYDDLHNLISTRLPTGATTSVGYASAAHPHLPTSVTDPQGNRLTRDYDEAGNLTKIRSEGLGFDVVTNTYNEPHGTLASRTDGNGNTTRFAYDERGNLTAEIPPAPMGTTRYTYDTLSRITSVTDGRGMRVDYAYDRLDRVVAITHNGQVRQTMTYDGIGNLMERAVPGVTTTFDWTTTPSASQPTRVERHQGADTEVVSYGYDPVGNLASLTDPGGTTNYGYDAANRLTSLADPFGQTTTFAYDNADRRTRTTFPGAGAQHTGYDNSGRQTSLRVTNTSGTELFKATYNYTRSNGADSDLMQSKTIAGTTTALTYDSLRRLTQAGGTTFAYDNANNLTRMGAASFTMNNANQLIRDGNRDRTYDGAGHLTGSTNPTETYVYNETGQYVAAHDAAGNEFTGTYDTVDQTQPRTFTLTSGGSTTTDVFTHTALGMTQNVRNGARLSVTRDPEGRLVTEKAGNGKRYNLITDYQGSVLALLDTTGQLAATYTYSAYGIVTANGAAAGDNPFHYLGHYEYGNHMLLGYRWYFPGWGRFLTPDPTKQELNPYAYAQCDPVNNSDPTGASTVCSHFATTVGLIYSAGGFLGGLATGIAIWSTGGALSYAGTEICEGPPATTGELAEMQYGVYRN